jgi:hypothetical protein
MTNMMETIAVNLGTDEVEDTVSNTPVAATVAADADDVNEGWFPVIDDTHVINIADSTTRNYVYIGRPRDPAKVRGIDWGNPFSHTRESNARWIVDSREEAVAKYEGWLARRYAQGKVKLHDLAALYGRTLGCFCKPHACHGDVLAKAAAWAIKQLMSAESRVQLVEAAKKAHAEGTPFTLAVVGSRTWSDASQIHELLDELREANPDLALVSGGAEGADGHAQAYAKEHGLECTVFEPDWDKHGRKAGFMRNAEIWSIADAGVAFWDGESQGTRHSFELYQGRPFHLVVDPEACTAQPTTQHDAAAVIKTMAEALLGVKDTNTFTSFD